MLINCNIGPLNIALEQLPLLNSQMNHFKLRKSICRCRFDVLKPLILFEEILDFQPANFVINAEWPLPRAKILANKKNAKKVDNLLEMPPDGAITTIVITFLPSLKLFNLRNLNQVGWIRGLH